MKNLVSLFGVLLFLVAPIAQAVQWNFEGPGSAWEDPNNWTFEQSPAGGIPTSSITVGIVAPCVSSATGNEAALYLQPQQMEVASGTLTVDNVHVFGGANLLISGGAMTGLDAFIGQAPSQSGSITVSGGSLTLTGLLSLGTLTDGNGKFSVMGSGATLISIGEFGAQGVESGGISTVEFGFDSGGITPITVAPTGYASLNEAIVNLSVIDPNWYPTYGATYTLITTSDIGSLIEIPDIVYDTSNWSLDITGAEGVDQTLVATFRGALRLSESDGDTTVTEGQPGDTYTVVMTVQPGASVTVDITIDDSNYAGQVTFDPNPLTFTTVDWDQSQLVTVTAVDDLVPEGLLVFDIAHTTTTSDANFDGRVHLLEITVIDDDEPNIIFVESSGSTDVIEGGANDTYDVYLNGLPASDVTVSITPDSQVNVDKPTLTFTPGNAGVPQTVTVTAVDDGDLESEHTGTITHSSASGDSTFDGIIVDLVVNIEDNECGAWGYHPQDLNEDCYINLLDFGEFATKWLGCSQPYDPECDDLR